MRILHRLGAVLAALMLCGASLAPSSVAAAPPSYSRLGLDPAVKIHPLLQVGAQAEPLRTVRVIVQKTKPDVHAVDLATKVLGQVVEEYKVVPAFVLELPQAAVSTLALDPDVRYISPDGPVQVIPQLPLVRPGSSTHPHAPKGVDEHHSSISPAGLRTVYPFVSGATQAWSGAANWDHNPLTGANVSVAVIDSGVDAGQPDLAGHVVAVNVNAQAAHGAADGYGHGTHVAGIIAGHDAGGAYLGVAPNATVISVKVTDDNGVAYESDLLRGLDWINQYRGEYHIGVVNLSVTTSLPSSYATSPIDAAVEYLYHQNVTVVAAAGNLGSAEDAVWYAPANDPLALTVGCLDDAATVASNDDSLCSISSHGITEDGFAKPDLVASGRKVYSALASGFDGQDVVLAREFPDRVTADGNHIRLSGTSMAAPVVAGAVALLLERTPGLTPDQVRQLLVGTATTYPGQTDTAGAVNIPAAIAASQHPPRHNPFGPLPRGATTPPAGAHTLVWDGSNWANAYWNTSHWDTSHWDTSHWDTSHWDTSHWDKSHWDTSHWDTSHWDTSHWDANYLDTSHWDTAYWDTSHWDATYWDTSHWDTSHWDNARSYD